MNYLLRQEYNNYFDYLARIVIMLYDEDRENKDGKNLLKATKQIGMYVNSLHMEYDNAERSLELYKKENRKLRLEIEQLKQQKD